MLLRPSTFTARRRRRVRRLLASGLLAAGLTGCAASWTIPPAPTYPADRADYWARMGRCEQPGDGWAGVQWNTHGPTYEGGLGFWYGTWDQWRRGDFTENAGDATPEQQMIVADRVYDEVGPSAWGCSRTVGWRP